MSQEILTGLVDTPAPLRFVVGRNTEVVVLVKNRNELAERWEDFDVSAARWNGYLRAYATRDAAALLISELLTKSASRTNCFRHPYFPGSTAYSGLFWEVVLVDTDNAQAGTPTGKRERVLFSFQAGIADAPQVNP